MNGIYVKLKHDERLALGQLAARERRDPRDQAALLLREALERKGLVQVSIVTNVTNPLIEQIEAEVKDEGNSTV